MGEDFPSGDLFNSLISFRNVISLGLNGTVCVCCSGCCGCGGVVGVSECFDCAELKDSLVV